MTWGDEFCAARSVDDDCGHCDERVKDLVNAALERAALIACGCDDGSGGLDVAALIRSQKAAR